MAGKTIILRIENGSIGLSPTLQLDKERTNLPFEYLLFRPQAPVYWEAEMLDYNGTKARLRVKVVNYQANDASGRFQTQVPKRAVRYLFFEPFDWQMLEPQLSYYNKSKLLLMLDHAGDNEPNADDKEQAWSAPAESNVRQKFEIPFSEVHFAVGMVHFERYEEKWQRTVKYAIANPVLLAEFDLIKPWFVKKLKTTVIRVDAVLHFKNGELERVEAESKQIAAINDNLLQTVKQQRLRDLTRLPKIETPDKSLFSTDEVFDSLRDELPGNPFRQSDKDILDFILENKKVRNHKQLAYLAGAKHAENQPLRFTLYPGFGFLFFIEGPTHYHFCWELLNSNATYLWSFPKAGASIALQYRQVEEEINAVRAAGRHPYRQQFRQAPEQKPFFFHYVEHQNIGSALTDAFPKWRARLEEVLV